MANAKTKEIGQPTATKISNGCGGRCITTYARGGELGPDLQLRAVTERQLNVRTGAPVAGTESRLSPLALPPEVDAAIEDKLKRWFVHSPARCERGCFCNPEGLSATRQETLTITPKVILKKKRASGWAPKGADTREQALEKLRNGTVILKDDANGNPIRVNPDLDELQVTAENCCAQIVLEIDVLNWFEYEYEVTGLFTLIDEIGECQSASGPVVT